MKQLSPLIATLMLFLSGCGDPFRHLETPPPFKRENEPADLSKAAMNNTSVTCDFSTQVATTKFPALAWPSSYPYQDAKFLELRSQTARSGYSSFTSSKSSDTSKTDRQKEICDQLENEFVGFDNPYYRSQHYLEQYSIAGLEEATKNLRTNEFAPIKPEKIFFAVEYADPKGDIQEPIKIKNIPIEITCKENTQVRVSEHNSRGFIFKHAEKCTFEAVDQEYKLNSGEKIKVSIVGSLGSDSEGLVLKIKEVSWRDTKK